MSGSLLGGVAFFNPTYAARPDNTGKALLRLAPHLDVDLIGSRLSIPIDLNVFTDREQPGLKKLVPSELRRRAMPTRARAGCGRSRHSSRACATRCARAISPAT